MTSPDNFVPEDAYGANTVASMQNATQPVIAQKKNSFITNLLTKVGKAFTDNVTGKFPTFQDEQNRWSSDLSLLEDTPGYGTAFMAKNWNVPANTWVEFPFDQPLGPNRNVSVTIPAAKKGVLTLKAGGLWRVDLHVHYAGYTEHYTYVQSDTGGYPVYAYYPINPRVLIEVCRPDGSVYTARQFDAVADLDGNASAVSAVRTRASVAFSHTFVLDPMPPATAPGASSSWYTVRVRFRFDEAFAFVDRITSECKVSGGTAMSGLTATRWSRDTSNNVVLEAAPDGGDLTT